MNAKGEEISRICKDRVKRLPSLLLFHLVAGGVADLTARVPFALFLTGVTGTPPSQP